MCGTLRYGRRLNVIKVTLSLIGFGTVYLYLVAINLPEGDYIPNELKARGKELENEDLLAVKNRLTLSYNSTEHKGAKRERFVTEKRVPAVKYKVFIGANPELPRPTPPPPLPECPPGLIPNSDYVILHTLRYCGNWSTYRFQPELEVWRYTQSSQCGGRFVTFNGESVLLHDVIINSELFKRNNAQDGMGNIVQDEGIDAFKLQSGFFQLVCPEIPSQLFCGLQDNHLTKYLQSVDVINGSTLVDDVVDKFTVILTRYEYNNVYHVIADLYNIFEALIYFNKTAEETQIMLLDNHPRIPLDSLWEGVFPEIFRIDDLRPLTHIKTVLWNKIGYHSHFMVFSEPRIPYIEEFREFILQRFGVSVKSSLHCKTLRILWIKRQDYIHNPEKPSEEISRKIQNEQELLSALQNKYPEFIVNMVAMETLDFRKQLQLVVETDVLIGMHGAGLTHALFLPDHAGVIEYIPKYWNMADGHFQGISRWRKLHYFRWKNNDEINEIPGNMYTSIPPQDMLHSVYKMLEMMC